MLTKLSFSTHTENVLRVVIVHTAHYNFLFLYDFLSKQSLKAPKTA